MHEFAAKTGPATQAKTARIIFWRELRYKLP